MADYTAVDKAIADANSLEEVLYTEESYALVEAAVEAVDRNKEISEQTLVDGMASAITTAIASLVEKDDVKILGSDTKIVSKVEACGQEKSSLQNDGEGGINAAVDGNGNTFWHTRYNKGCVDGNGKHWFKYELNSEYMIYGLKYLPRQYDGTCNGTITAYTILVSDDGDSWTDEEDSHPTDPTLPARYILTWDSVELITPAEGYTYSGDAFYPGNRSKKLRQV